jgi:hypothetical protein
VATTFDDIIESRDLLNSNKYGNHHVAIFNPTDMNSELLFTKSNHNEIKIGTINNYGQHVIDNTTIKMTVGSFDLTAYEMGRIQLREGRFPIEKNEIVIEECYFDLLNDIKIGDKISLTDWQLFTNQDFVIVGVTKNYSGSWNVPEDVVRGYNDIPSLLIAFDSNIKAECCLLLKFKSYDHNLIVQYLDNIKVNIYSQIFNSNYYEIGRIEIDNMEDIRFLFILVIIVFYILAASSVLKLLLEKTREEHRLLLIHGHKKSKIFLAFYSQICLCFFIASIIFLLILSIGNLFSITALTRIKPQLLVVTFALILVITILIASSQLTKIVNGIQHQYRYHSIDKTKPMKMESNFLYSLINNNFKTNIIKVAPLLLAVIFLTFSLSFVFDYFNNMYQDSEPIPDYTAVSRSLTTSETYGSYDLYYKNDYFDTEIIDSLISKDYIQHTISKASVDGAVLLFNDTNVNREWKNFANNAQDVIPIVPHDNYFVISDYCFYIVDDKTINTIKESYKDEINNDVTSDVLLFTNGINQKLDSITLSRISLFDNNNYRTGFLPGTLSDTNYDEFQLQIDAHILKPFAIENAQIQLDENIPTIIMSLSNYSNNNFFDGLRSVSVYFQDGISDAERRSFKYEFMNYVQSFPDYYMYCLEDEVSREIEFMTVLERSTVAMSIIVCSFIGLNFFSIMFFAMINRRVTLSLYRVIGLSNRMEFVTVIVELLSYSVFYIVISLILSNAYALLTNSSNFFENSLPSILFVGAFMIICSFVISRILFYLQGKESIASIISE